MAVVKLTKNKTGVLFVSDDGVIYSCAIKVLQELIAGRVRAPYSILTRLPFPVSPGRFPLSKIYWSGELFKPDDWELFLKSDVFPKDLNITYDYMKYKEDKHKGSVVNVQDLDDW